MTSIYQTRAQNKLNINGLTYKLDARTGIENAIIRPKPLLKEDTTYYNDPHKKYLDIFPSINPAYDDQYLSVFGRVDRSDIAVNEKYVQDDAIISMGNNNVGDELRFGSGTSWAVPYIKKAKIFQYGATLKHLDYLAYNGGKNRQLNARVADELSTDLNLMRYTLMAWMTGYTTDTAAIIDPDLDWKFPFEKPAGTGSATSPVMIQEHASNGAAGETVRDQTTAIMTNDHDGAKTKDFVKNTFGKAILEFSNIRNEATGQRMLKPDGNNFSVFCHPHLIWHLKNTHPYNGVQDDMNTTYFDQATGLGVNFVPCYNVDTAFDNTQDGTIEYVMVANPQDNIKIGWVADYMVNPWESDIQNGIKQWYKHAWQKAFAWVRPFTVDYGTTYYKAVGHYQFTYSS